MMRLLGVAARLARSVGLAKTLVALRDGTDAVLLRLGRPILKSSRDGVVLRGFLRHRSFLAGVGRGDYEPTLRAVLLESVEPGCLFVDAGAHIGFYSVFAAKAGADVVAVEPDPYNRAALVANIGELSVDVHAAAISDAEGVAVFYPSDSTTGSSMLQRTDIAMRAAIPVTTTTIDHLTRGRRDRLVVVKLDLEGGEPAALAGATDTLRESARLTVVAEVNPGAVALDEGAAGPVAEPLIAAGLRVQFIDQSGIVGDVPRGRVKGNIVARRG